jgi:hypothetical protein
MNTFGEREKERKREKEKKRKREKERKREREKDVLDIAQCHVASHFSPAFKTIPCNYSVVENYLPRWPPTIFAGLPFSS